MTRRLFRELATQRRTRATAKSGTECCTTRATTGLFTDCRTSATANRTANDGARFTFTLSRHRSAGATANRTTYDRTCRAAYFITNCSTRSPTDRTTQAALKVTALRQCHPRNQSEAHSNHHGLFHKISPIKFMVKPLSVTCFHLG
jgi:hypothetical protein